MNGGMYTKEQPILRETSQVYPVIGGLMPKGEGSR